MNHRTRLGPAAVFLAIVVMVISTLAFLTAAAVSADLTMAKRSADITAARYYLEASCADFYSEASKAGINGTDLSKLPGVSVKEDTYIYETEADGYKLEAKITKPDSTGGFTVISQRTVRLWEADDPVKDIWKGN